jgi:hypothetical protein
MTGSRGRHDGDERRARAFGAARARFAAAFFLAAGLADVRAGGIG